MIVLENLNFIRKDKELPKAQRKPNTRDKTPTHNPPLNYPKMLLSFKSPCLTFIFSENALISSQSMVIVNFGTLIMF